MPRGGAAACASLVALCLAPSTSALAATLRGHLKTQDQYLAAPTDSLATSLGYREAKALSLDMRLIGHLSAGPFAFDADYSLQAAGGKAVALQNDVASLEPSLYYDRSATQWFDLDHTSSDTGHTLTVQSLDRFAMTYTSERWVFKLGRQAYSWGNGIVFRPLDLFDPFAPDAVDMSYKPGIDAVYAQRLFADGSDVTALLVPRRDPTTGRLSHEQSSAAVKWHGFGAALQLDLLAAVDYRDTTLGLGLSGSWGQAVWRLDVVPVRLETGGTHTSFVANLEHAWQWRSRNISGFIEYFRNGFGKPGDHAWDELDPALLARLARGQLFDTGRDYLAAGLRVQWTPLLEIDPVLLANASDHSALFVLQGSFSMAENVALDFGARSAIGPQGTEFGGLPLSSGSAVFDTPPTRLYARIAVYF